MRFTKIWSAGNWRNLSEENIMKTLISTLCAAVFSLSPLATGQAGAASVTPLALISAGSQPSALADLVQVQHRQQYQNNRRGADRRNPHRHGYDNRGRRIHPQAPPRQRSRSSGGPDLGSAIVGAIIGGVIVNQLHAGQQQHAPVRSGTYLSHSHIDWCHSRWRSYRVSDNSYQPYNGPRRICVSPYGP